MMYINIFEWVKALDLAEKFDKMINIVLSYRKEYLDALNINEDLKVFLKYHDQDYKILGMDMINAEIKDMNDDIVEFFLL